jgi:SulP family sulfate permease
VSIWSTRSDLLDRVDDRATTARRPRAFARSSRALLPSRGDYRGLRATWRADLVAGVTVAIVALPLALAFGITTGLGANAGLVTAIVAGFVAAVFGGSHVQVSGPTGAMTVVLVPIVARYGRDAVFVVGLLAGALLVAAALARLGRYLAYIPWPVVEGFTVGIAAIIVLQQVPAALGVPKPEGENTAAVAARALQELGSIRFAELGLVLIVTVVMVVTPRIRRSLPASLLAVLAATLVATVASVDVARIGRLPDSFPTPALPSTAFGEVRGLLSAAVAVAILAALESLLSAKVADGMADNGRHDADRELLGQGLANLASPLFGGMPATGAIARTAVNVRAGARSRVAAASHALVLLLVVLLGSRFVSEIPLAALAGVLMVTGARMVEVHNVRAVLRSTRSDAAVLVLTAAATITFDLIVAVEVGIAVAAALALRHVANTSEARVEALPPDELVSGDLEADLLAQHIVVYRFDGALFFGASQRFLTELTAVSDVRVVIMRLATIRVLDATGAQALGEIVRELEARGITVLLKGVRPEHLRILSAVGVLDRLAHERHVFDRLPDAIAHARLHAARDPHHMTAARAVP